MLVRFQGHWTQWGCWSVLELEQPLICVDVSGAVLCWAGLRWAEQACYPSA